MPLVPRLPVTQELEKSEVGEAGPIIFGTCYFGGILEGKAVHAPVLDDLLSYAQHLGSAPSSVLSQVPQVRAFANAVRRRKEDRKGGMCQLDAPAVLID